VTAKADPKRRIGARKQVRGKVLSPVEQVTRAFAIMRPLLAIRARSGEIINPAHHDYRSTKAAAEVALRGDIEDVLTHFNVEDEKSDPWRSRSASYRNKRLQSARATLKRLHNTIPVPEFRSRIDDLDRLARELLKPGYAKRNSKQQWAADEALRLLLMWSASPKLKANAGGALMKLAAVLYGDAQADLRHHYIWPSLKQLKMRRSFPHFDVEGIRGAVDDKTLHPLWADVMIKRYSRAPRAKKAGPH
jgi:hypothetical protein